MDTFRPETPKNNNQIRKFEKHSFFWLYPSAQLETFHADPPLETILAQNTAALVGIPARATGAGPGYRKLALPGLKSVDFFGLKVISLGQNVFRSVTLSGQKYSPIGPALKASDRAVSHKKLVDEWKWMENLLSKTPYKFKNSYGGTPEPQTPRMHPGCADPLLK